MGARVKALHRTGIWRRSALTSASLFLSSCSSIGVLHPQGPVGSAQRQILFNSLAIMLCVVVPAIIGTICFAWWFRASNTKAKYQPDWAYSGKIELVVWAIPTLVILFLGGITWIGSHDLDPYKPLQSNARPLNVEVVSLDWKWLFIYPEQKIASVNELTIPTGVPVHFHLTSATVMNAFFIPQLGSMIYTMNGMATQLHLQADHQGVFEGLSSHYSGDGFSDMRFLVHAVPPSDFDSWAATTRNKGKELDKAGYAQLLKESKNVAPSTYGKVAPDLFHNIVMRTAPEASGPQKGQPSVQVSPRSED